MTFEDYNYGLHNQYILVNKDNIYQNNSSSPLPISAGFRTKVNKVSDFENENDKTGLPALTRKMMNESQRDMEIYKYDDMNTETES